MVRYEPEAGPALVRSGVGDDARRCRAGADRPTPAAGTAYEIPNAMVGYQSGFGEVADIWPQDGDASYRHLRVILLTAVKNDVALTIAAVGPYREFGPDFGPGRPSGANLQLAEDMGRYINGFMWRGDRPR